MQVKNFIRCGVLCGAVLAADSSLAWGAFSSWTNATHDASNSYCTNRRSTGSVRKGLTYVEWFQDGSIWTWSFAQNVSAPGKGAELWVQTSNARGGEMGPQAMGHNIVTNDAIFVFLQTPLFTTLARCAVE